MLKKDAAKTSKSELPRAPEPATAIESDVDHEAPAAIVEPVIEDPVKLVSFFWTRIVIIFKSKNKNNRPNNLCNTEIIIIF